VIEPAPGRIAVARFITNREVDRVLRGSSLYLKSGWRSGRGSERITLDLSAVEFADYGALARLLLIIDGAAHHGVAVTLVPPANDLRAGEVRVLAGDHLELSPEALERQRVRILRAVAMRRRFRHFLTNTGFVRAARLPLLGQHLLTPVWAEDQSELPSDIGDRVSMLLESDAGGSGDFLGGSHDPLPAISAFEWIDPREAHESEVWEDRYVSFLHDNDIIMSRRHAKAIVSTVLRELIDNVYDHAEQIGEGDAHCTALVGALTVSAGRYASWRRDTTLYASDLPFNAWLTARNTPFVRIVVGDSGQGIRSSLLPRFVGVSPSKVERTRTSDIVMFAFEAGASRHTDDGLRGTGLPAIRRFLRSYEGRVGVRTGDAKAGYWSPDGVTNRFTEDRLAYSPGTFVEVGLCLTLHSRTDELLHGRSEGDESDAGPRLVRGVTGQELATSVNRAVEARDGEHVTFVGLLSDWPKTRRDRLVLAEDARRVSRSVEGTAALVLVIPAASRVDLRSSFSLLDEIYESDSAMSQARASDDDWTPPILLLSGDGRPTWTGGSEQLRGLLYGALAGRNVALRDIEARFQRGAPDFEYLMVVRDWVSVVDATGVASIGCRISLKDIDELVADYVESQLVLAIL
jgi:hypothetical protein